MAKNSSLYKAGVAKQDEFYTQLSDIERELRHYEPYFVGKTIFCNCDDPEYSNFWLYFQLNFYRLGLKKLVSTHYEPEKPSYKMEIVSTNTAKGDGIQIGIPDYVKTPLSGNGDFRSQECIDILKEADIVITNPPFSLFREYVAQLMEYDKKFIIIGSKGAITYKEIFPLIQNNRMWLGYGFNAGNAYFAVPQTDRTAEYADGVYNPETGLVKFRNCGWYSNLDTPKRHEELILYKQYDPALYPHYDNFDAIEVGKTADIPCDYYGNMGVPITFLDVYNPDQFEILGITKTWYGSAIKKYPKQLQISANGTESIVGKLNDGAVIRVDTPPVGKTYYVVDGCYYIQTFPRILIRRKKPNED